MSHAMAHGVPVRFVAEAVGYFPGRRFLQSSEGWLHGAIMYLAAKHDGDVWDVLEQIGAHAPNMTALASYHNLHGFGHGVMLHELLSAAGTRQLYNASYPVQGSSYTTDQRAALAKADKWCDRAPDVSRAYLCAEGAYMSYFLYTYPKTAADVQNNWDYCVTRSHYKAMCFFNFIGYMGGRTGGVFAAPSQETLDNYNTPMDPLVLTKTAADCLAMPDDGTINSCVWAYAGTNWSTVRGAVDPHSLAAFFDSQQDGMVDSHGESLTPTRA